MRKEELVYIWLANGLLEFKNKEPEDVGEDVFGELLLHSFFQDMKKNEGKIETVKIHDLMHDLASAIMKSEYLHIEVKVGMSINSSIQDDEIRPRHVSIIVLPSSSELSSVDVSSIHRFLSSHQRHLRTFSLISNEDRGMFASHVISVISDLKNLRVLRVESWNAGISLPISFGDKLKHLRYLNLRQCGFSSLHGESFHGMKNLQFLDLSQNNRLKTLPDSMGEYKEHLKHFNLSGCGLSSLHAELFHGMKNLQILDLRWNKSLKTLPDSMGEYMEHLKHLNLSGCGLSSLPAELFYGMKNLRFLDLSRISKYMETIPDSIGNLEQLRHFNLSKNEGLKVLSESLGNLTKLETLKLNDCWGLITLPQSTSKLCSLRQLENQGCSNLRGMPSGIGEGLSRLEKLSMWVWGSKESENIEGLRGLSLLAGSLLIYIKGLRKEDDEALRDVEEEVLTNKTNLSQLVILFSDNGGDDVSSSSEQALRILKPPSNIESLRIGSYKGRRFPEWMEMRDPHSSSSSFPRLRTILLNDINYVEEWMLNWRHKEECLPALQLLELVNCYRLKGLPKELGNLETLKSLYVCHCEELVSVPQLIYLESLSIIECSELVSMPQLELMASLKELIISNCPKLKFVFHGLQRLTSLQRLEISGCPGVVIPKEELDPLVALRGPSFLKWVDKKLIHEDSTTT
ncbi:hypothetical protein Syun_028924 [Stephania yunnanensis]|uniref:Uncharacterized protein n=1 Tax=Stephania yunnanensis TaxID=152371 RepID=A0AAP0E4F7_9MAGN